MISIYLLIITRRNGKNEPGNNKVGYLQGVVGSRDEWVRTIGGSDASLNITFCMVLIFESILILYIFKE